MGKANAYDFAKAIINEKPISIFNYGSMERDFTYIDDVVESYLDVALKKLNAESINANKSNISQSIAKHRIFNVGNSHQVNLEYFINLLEESSGKKLFENMRSYKKRFVSTFSDTELLSDWTNYKPSTSIEEGIRKFAEWFKSYYSVLKSNVE